MAIRRPGLRAQSISEYAILFGVVVAVLTGMNIYMKRGIQGTVKAFADRIALQQDAERKINKAATGSSVTTTQTTTTDNPSRVQKLGGVETVGVAFTQHQTGTIASHEEQLKGVSGTVKEEEVK